MFISADDVQQALYETFTLLTFNIHKRKMNFGELIYQQPENIKKLLRKIENLEKKFANARVAILFIKT